MNDKFEDILDSAIAELAEGKTLQAVLANYPAHAKQLAGILPMVSPALSFPKNKVPRPNRRRRYVAALHVPLQVRLQRIIRIALIPATAILILVGLGHFAQAAQQALPGSPLFAVKLLAERTRVAVTLDQTQKAKLELGYSEKRLSEVQTVLRQENSSSDQKVAALNELKDQTQKTLSVVPQIATSNAINNKDDSLLKNLIAVNNQQKNLLQNVSGKDEAKAIAATTLQVTEDGQKAIATLLAAVNDQTLVDLLDRQISITGTVSAVDYKNQKITVENNSFIINSSTDIKSGDAALKLADIPAKTQVTIVGNKTKDGIVANSITVIVLAAAPAKGEVKGVSTPAKNSERTEPTKTTAPKNDNTDPNQTPTNSNASQPDPNKVTGGFIIEQPDQP
jgi:hypothetical protein